MTTADEDLRWMRHAIELARRAETEGEVPIGAVVVREGEIIGEGWNRPILSNDPTAHAEILALRAAAKHVQNYRLPGTILYVTIEPCPMCAGAMVHARVARLVFGAADPIAGSAGSTFNLLQSDQLNHRAEVRGGVAADECSAMLRAFFKTRR